LIAHVALPPRRLEIPTSTPKKAEHPQMRWREGVYEVQENKLQVLERFGSGSNVEDRVTQRIEFFCLMAPERRLSGLKNRRNELFIFAEIIETETLNSVLQIAKPPLQILQPSIASLSYRGAEQTDQLRSDTADERDDGQQSLATGVCNVLECRLRKIPPGWFVEDCHTVL
jgi:hypothetical protein